MIVFGFDIEEYKYAYRLDGPYDEKRRLRFDPAKILLDPYARSVTGELCQSCLSRLPRSCHTQRLWLGIQSGQLLFANFRYASKKEENDEGTELKHLIGTLHTNGIDVILDVVFNHTAEGNELGPYFSFKGFDNNIYYMLMELILDCLPYWVTDYRADGFHLTWLPFSEEMKTALQL